MERLNWDEYAVQHLLRDVMPDARRAYGVALIELGSAYRELRSCETIDPERVKRAYGVVQGMRQGWSGMTGA